MNRKIKLIWDFRGPAASKTAEHHQLHLKEYIKREGITSEGAGFQDITEMHSIAFMAIDESNMITLRDALKPHRAELWSTPKKS